MASSACPSALALSLGSYGIIILNPSAHRAIPTMHAVTVSVVLTLTVGQVRTEVQRWPFGLHVQNETLVIDSVIVMVDILHFLSQLSVLPAHSKVPP